MNDADFDALKARIVFHAEWWIEWLGLAHWDWRIVHQRLGIKDVIGNRNDESLMVIRVDAKYMSFTIEVDYPNMLDSYLNQYAKPEDAEVFLERTVVHELCHALVAEMRECGKTDEADDHFHEERVVAQLTLAFRWIANHGDERPYKQLERQGWPPLVPTAQNDETDLGDTSSRSSSPVTLDLTLSGETLSCPKPISLSPSLRSMITGASTGIARSVMSRIRTSRG